MHGCRPKAVASGIYRAIWRIERAKRTRTVERHPRLDDLDEYPLVPFLIEDDRRVLYDSSAIAQWIDDCHPAPYGRLIPDRPGARVRRRA